MPMISEIVAPSVSRPILCVGGPLHGQMRTPNLGYGHRCVQLADGRVERGEYGVCVVRGRYVLAYLGTWMPAAQWHERGRR